VDDHPENNVNERRMCRHLNARIDTAQTTDEALGILMNSDYDVVISDMACGDDATAGLGFLRQLRDIKRTTPLILYVGMIDPERGVPPQAFGITNRPDGLLHLVLDAPEMKSH
jgi:response regulator RpfG family c-di-GMP phosphodiesterase